MGHQADRAEFQIAHGSGGERHHLRLQRQATSFQPPRQRHAGGLQHLRGLQILLTVPEYAVQRPVRRRDVLHPQAKDVTLEETGANTETDKQFIYNIYTELLKDVDAKSGKPRRRTYEDSAKDLFTKEPANMKLLVVVDKLLTGFDAPPCTCLYIDKSMQDHGLFQAICRTNRLDGEDKEFGSNRRLQGFV